MPFACLGKTSKSSCAVHGERNYFVAPCIITFSLYLVHYTDVDQSSVLCIPRISSLRVICPRYCLLLFPSGSVSRVWFLISRILPPWNIELLDCCALVCLVFGFAAVELVCIFGDFICILSRTLLERLNWSSIAAALCIKRSQRSSSGWF